MNRLPVMLPIGYGLFLRCFYDGSARICQKNGDFPYSEIQGIRAMKMAKNKKLIDRHIMNHNYYCTRLTKVGKAMANLLQ